MSANRRHPLGRLVELLGGLSGAASFDTLRQRTASLRERVEQARQHAQDVARDVGLNLKTAKAEANAAARSLGLPLPHEKVIDVGQKPSVLSRLGTAAATFALALLLAGSLLSFSAFFVQLLVATFLASRILGLELDLGRFTARTAA